jgi:hypothetical protein
MGYLERFDEDRFFIKRHVRNRREPVAGLAVGLNHFPET